MSPETRKKRAAYCKKWRERLSIERVEELAAIARKRTKEWRLKNRERRAYHVRIENSSPLARARKARWKSKNAAYDSFHARLRQALKRKAVPVWANREKIEAVYVEARRISQETGIKHHVDHIVPLTHPDVCGLHWEENMRVIPAIENYRKNNHFDPAEWYL